MMLEFDSAEGAPTAMAVEMNEQGEETAATAIGKENRIEWMQLL